MLSTALPSTLLLLLAASFTPSTALLANSNSPCAAQCGNVLTDTLGDRDIACSDDSYSSSTGVAAVFRSCTECQLASSYVDPVTQAADLQWALYNMRYAVSWCLFGYPDRADTPDTPCITSTACGTLSDFFEYNALGTNSSAYGYCTNLDQGVVPKCDACLNQQTNTFFLNNFLSILTGACENQAAPGQLLTIQGDPFSPTVQANVTTPSATPLAYVHATGLSLGSKVGIAVGGLLVILSVSGFLIVCLGRRKRRAFLALKEQEMQDAPKPSYPWDNRRKKSRFSLNRIQTYVPDSVFPEQTSSGAVDYAASNSSVAPYFDSPVSMTKVSAQAWPTMTASHTSINHAATDWTPLSEQAGHRQPVTWSPYHDGPSSAYTSPASGSNAISFRNMDWPINGGVGNTNGTRYIDTPSPSHTTPPPPQPAAVTGLSIARQSSISLARSKIVDVRSSRGSRGSSAESARGGSGSGRTDGIELREVSPPPNTAARVRRDRSGDGNMI